MTESTKGGEKWGERWGSSGTQFNRKRVDMQIPVSHIYINLPISQNTLKDLRPSHQPVRSKPGDALVPERSSVLAITLGFPSLKER